VIDVEGQDQRGAGRVEAEFRVLRRLAQSDQASEPMPGLWATTASRVASESRIAFSMSAGAAW
jgi:hypothetical protein